LEVAQQQQLLSPGAFRRAMNLCIDVPKTQSSIEINFDFAKKRILACQICPISLMFDIGFCIPCPFSKLLEVEAKGFCPFATVITKIIDTFETYHVVSTKEKTTMLYPMIILLFILHTLLNAIICCLQLNTKRGADANRKVDY
jgi:hypothetical protein